MKIAMVDGKIICADCGAYFQKLRDTGRFTWDRKTKTMQGDLCRLTLQALSECCKLPPNAAAQYQKEQEIYEAMEEQRRSKEPKLLTSVPLKNCELMKHQIVGINMALLLFGLVENKKEET